MSLPERFSWVPAERPVRLVGASGRVWYVCRVCVVLLGWDMAREHAEFETAAEVGAHLRACHADPESPIGG